MNALTIAREYIRTYDPFIGTAPSIGYDGLFNAAKGNHPTRKVEFMHAIDDIARKAHPITRQMLRERGVWNP